MSKQDPAAAARGYLDAVSALKAGIDESAVTAAAGLFVSVWKAGGTVYTAGSERTAGMAADAAVSLS
ncbi:MAG: hypothetical protein IJL69_07100, partial [Oscillospiraceae bacterium]|nr:hypothetical protein [Oscillospiraceae bacterium]